MRKHFRTKGTLNGQRIGLARRMFLLLSVVFIAAIANMAMGGGGGGYLKKKNACCKINQNFNGLKV